MIWGFKPLLQIVYNIFAVWIREIRACVFTLPEQDHLQIAHTHVHVKRAVAVFTGVYWVCVWCFV